MQKRKSWDLLIIVCAAGIPIGLVVGGIGIAVHQDRAHFASRLQEGRTIVKAIYEYKAKNGDWPEKLDDLVPGFLAGVPKDWVWGYFGPSCRRLNAHAAFHCYLDYYFSPDNGEPVEPGMFPQGIDHGWIRNDEGTRSFIGED
jgi:hypothetical protein